jgi:hypothetical protein
VEAKHLSALNIVGKKTFSQPSNEMKKKNLPGPTELQETNNFSLQNNSRVYTSVSLEEYLNFHHWTARDENGLTKRAICTEHSI